MIGDFSLLSIGDTRGKVIDIEFASTADGMRKYFDVANSFVIPLYPFHIVGLHPYCPREMKIGVKSLGCSFADAMEALRSSHLVIHQPEDVMHGLPLYAHAIVCKGLTPPSEDLQAQYSDIFCGSFMRTCEDLAAKGEDPIRFLRSFVRSHYMASPLHAVGMVAQLLAELVHFNNNKPSHEAAEDRVFSIISSFIGELLFATTEGGVEEDSCNALWELTSSIFALAICKVTFG